MRHIMRHKSLYSLITLVFMLIAGLLGALPIVARQLATDNLQRSIAQLHTAERHLLLTSDEIPEEINGRLISALGDLYRDTFKLRQTSALSAPYMQRGDQLILYPGEQFDAMIFHLHAFEGLENHVTVLAGNLPEFHSEPIISSDGLLMMEAAVGPDTAAELSLEIGDTLIQSNLSQAFEIVGIVEATTADDPRWWADQTMPFSRWYRIQFQPDWVELNAGLILTPEDMARSYPGNIFWRVLLESEQLDSAQILPVANQIRNLEVTLTGEQVAVTSPLLAHLNDFLENLASSQATLLLLAMQTILVILMTIYLLGQLLLEQTADEIRLLSARGFSVTRITVQFGIRYAMLAFGVALPLGVLAAATAVWLRPVAPSSQTVWFIPSVSWGLAIAALLIAWLVLIAPIPYTARQILVGRPQKSRQSRLVSLLIDATLFGVGLLIIWQLQQFTNGAQDHQNRTALDPLLLLGPTIILVGSALILRYIAPLAIQALAAIGRRGRSFLVPAALTWLGRDNSRSGRLILLVTVSTGLTLFAIVFTHSLAIHQAEIALYRSGASLRLTVPRDQLETVESKLSQDSRVQATTALFRGTTAPQVDNPSLNAELNFLALDLDTNGDLAIGRLPMGLSDQLSLATLSPLNEAPNGNAIPVLISRLYVTPGTRLFDQTEIQIGRELVPVEIRGIIDIIPTLPSPFIVANLRDIQPILDRQPPILDLDKQYELWVTLPEGTSGKEILQTISWNAGDELPQLISDASALHDEMGHHLIVQQVDGMFRFNAGLLIFLTAGMLLILLLLDGLQRRTQLAVMRSLGVSARGLFGLLIWEGIALMGVGILFGIGLGTVLARFTHPLLILTLSTSSGTVNADTPLIYPWGQLGLVTLGVTLLYFLMITIAAVVTVRIDTARMLRL